MGKFNVSDLLNDKSKANAPAPALKTVILSVHDLLPSDNNFYSTDDIADLKASIEIFGVRQTLLVRPAPSAGKYEVIAGHRRRAACLQLAAEGKTEFERVPCYIDTENDETRARILLIMTNSTARELTDWEKARQSEELRPLLKEYAERSGTKGRVRDLISDILKISPAQVAKLDAINANLTPEFQAEFKAGKLPVSTAYEISGLPEAEQKATFAEYTENGGITLQAVKAKKKPATPPTLPKPKRTQTVFERVTKNPKVLAEFIHEKFQDTRCTDACKESCVDCITEILNQTYAEN
ncbi:hypothetical protein FACS1894217_04730 [Clostridia bacterium]|nr:hypothetical protein FACS1894217_04730 [Clostridia bacterium]